MELTVVPAGEFILGDDRLPDSAPQHRVVLAEFSLGKFPVTNAEYAAFVEAGGYAQPRFWTEWGWKWRQARGSDAPAYWREPPFNRPNHPVVGVSWYEAAAFCAWLTERDGTRVYRLPSEAEWEKAARGAQGQTWPWGPHFEPGRANTAELGIGATTPVDAFPGGVSVYGVWDLVGNVFEWTASRWGKNWQELLYPYPYTETDGRSEPEGSWARVMRGGSWYGPYPEALPARRSRYLPGSRGSNIGFRIAV